MLGMHAIISVFAENLIFTKNKKVVCTKPGQFGLLTRNHFITARVTTVEGMNILPFKT